MAKQGAVRSNRRLLISFIFCDFETTGKTFTMMGSSPTTPSQVKVNAGLYVLAARDMFRLLAKSNSPDERKAKQVCMRSLFFQSFHLYDCWI